MFAALLAAACAGPAPGPLAKPGATAAQAERDRLDCEGRMYAERTLKGRGAPNWNLYEFCMTERGYARAH